MQEQAVKMQELGTRHTDCSHPIRAREEHTDIEVTRLVGG